MLAYRDSSERFSGAEVIKALVTAFDALRTGSPTRDQVIDALLRVGEVECALADAESSDSRKAAEISDAAAALLVNASDAGAQVERASLVIPQLRLPDIVNLRPAEGFAYYALHPLQYAAMVENFAGERVLAVIGIRSIGTTLSAVVAAAARGRGIEADRITVRPQGHPYDRELTLSDDELRWVQERADRGAVLLVVDEGPGRSGSSFLATAEALERAGVSSDCIVLLCSYQPDVNLLLARDVQRRWARYKSLHARRGSLLLPFQFDRVLDLSAGEWRRHVYADEAEWPASWIQNERLKFLDGDRLFKFEGYGRFGAAVRERAEAIAHAGFGPDVKDAGDGFVAYEFFRGVPRRADLTRSTMDRLAGYCAFRVSEFAVKDAQSDGIAEMLTCNLREEFGCAPQEIELPVMRPVVIDGRMHPHEWVRTAQGELMKTDGASHGDDHFYPGPTDIAWDLAGCIVEWRMNEPAIDYLLGRYTALSGDQIKPHIDGWTLAYLAFRIGYTRMAIESLRSTAEKPRLQADCLRYREMAERIIQPVRRRRAELLV